jgi:hypothetical protein
MSIARGLIGGILLFLGRELNFLLAASMAAFLALRLTPLLPGAWPGWSHSVLVILLALLAGAVPMRNERIGYYVSGFLAGASLLVEYYAPGVLTLPVLPFLVGGAIGALVIGIFTEWALLVFSCLLGAVYVTQAFILSPMAEMLIGSGLFVVGALTQAIMMKMQSSD